MRREESREREGGGQIPLEFGRFEGPKSAGYCWEPLG